MKKCTKCCEIKDLTCFHKHQISKDGLRSQCKNCRKISNKIYEINNSDKIKKQRKEYRNNNKNKKKETDKKYYENNKKNLYLKARNRILNNEEQTKEYNKQYRLKNKDKLKEKRKLWKLKNKEKINKYFRNYTPSTNSKIASLLRHRIRSATKVANVKKFTSTNILLGCSMEFFKQYIESKFTTGMTWENRGVYGWHLDHIIPCSSFDLSDLEQQKQCFHYTNIQPLWATMEIAMLYGESSEYIGNLEKNKY